jgi:hypothetical protein
MWATFMKAATKNDAAAWFAAPRDVVAVQVCRLSGSLPGAGCGNAPSISSRGEITYKSMVYTDYFVRGAEPRHTCAFHAIETVPYPEPEFSATAFDGLGGLLGVDPVVAPPPANALPSATAVVPAAGISESALPPPAPAEAAPVAP